MSEMNFRAILTAGLSAFLPGGYHTLQFTRYGLILGLWH